MPASNYDNSVNERILTWATTFGSVVVGCDGGGYMRAFAANRQPAVAADRDNRLQSEYVSHTRLMNAPRGYVRAITVNHDHEVPSGVTADRLDPSGSSGEPLSDFDDVRDIQKTLKSRDFTLTSESDTTTGPASLVLLDPDGNPILIDQHAPKPQKK